MNHNFNVISNTVMSPELRARQLIFESGENTLRGYIYGAENTKGLVVISHGLGFDAEHYLPEVLYFVEHGWRVFSFDNTGTHESKGQVRSGFRSR